MFTTSGLSPDNPEKFESKLLEVCKLLNDCGEIPENMDLDLFPAIDFGLENGLAGLEIRG